MPTATITEFVVSESTVEHVKSRVRHHLKQRQKRTVPKASQTLVDRVMAKYEDVFPDQFWHRVGFWYVQIMKRTLPKLRGFAATDFFEIVAAHMRNSDEYTNRDTPDNIEAVAQRDAYITCTAGIHDYTPEYVHETPDHDEW